MLLDLDDDTLGRILHHCRPSKSFPLTASACKRFCEASRASTPYNITLNCARLARLPSICASTTVPFRGCTCLCFELGASTAALPDGQVIVSALAAPGKWTALQRLEVRGLFAGPNQQGEQAAEDQYVGRLFDGLSSLPHVRELSLCAPISSCCQSSLTAATHLTLLEFEGCQPRAASSSDSSGHSLIDNRTSTSSSSTATTTTDSSSSSSSCLPSTLVRLDCTLHGVEGIHWLHNLRGCPGLRELSVTHIYQYTQLEPYKRRGTLPPSVLDLAAQHTPGLTHLVLHHRVGSLDMRRGTKAPQPWFRFCPPRPEPLSCSPHMSQLTRLQQLRLDAELRIRTDQDWRHFGCLAALKGAAGLHFLQPPPSGVQLPHLTQLRGSVDMSGADTVLLLAACPALREVGLQVTPPKAAGTGSSSSSSDGGSSGGNAVAASLAACVITPNDTIGSVHLGWGPGITAKEAAAHFAAMVPALARLPSLSLTWPQSTRDPHLPDLCRLTTLTSLRLAGRHGGSGCVQADLVLALQPLGHSLRHLSLECLPLVTPEVVLGLQAVLPALRWFDIYHCAPLPCPAQHSRPQYHLLELLKRLLRHGLTMTCDDIHANDSDINANDSDINANDSDIDDGILSDDE